MIFFGHQGFNRGPGRPDVKIASISASDNTLVNKSCSSSFLYIPNGIYVGTHFEWITDVRRRLSAGATHIFDCPGPPDRRLFADMPGRPALSKFPRGHCCGLFQYQNHLSWGGNWNYRNPMVETMWSKKKGIPTALKRYLYIKRVPGPLKMPRYIAVTPHEHQGVLNHCQIDYLFNSLFSKKQGGSHCGRLFPSQTANKAFPYHDVIISQNFASTHYGDIKMGAMASQITKPTVVSSTVYSGADQRKHQSSASLAFVRGIHRWPVNSCTKGQYRGKCFHLMMSLWFHCLHSFDQIGVWYSFLILLFLWTPVCQTNVANVTRNI